jgi:Protein of unknown function (DUF3574)
MNEKLRLPIVAMALATFGGVAFVSYLTVAPRPAFVSCTGSAAPYARLELLFGRSRKDGTEIGDAEWRAFLDSEVTPRFPDGLTVLDAYGQWRNSAGTIAKEKSVVLLIWYRPAAESQAKIEAIRSAYKARFGQESVLRVDSVSCVSF